MTDNSIRLINTDLCEYTIKVHSSLIEQLKSLSFICYFLVFIACFLLAGCSTTQPPAPVVDRVKTDPSGSASQSIEANNQFYVVQKGDTLYSISLNHGVDFKKLAEWNDIADPRTLRPGQRISLFAPARDSQPALFALSPQPLSTDIEPAVQPFAEALPERQEWGDTKNDTANKVKTGPKAFKLPYSEQNAAQLQYPANSSSSQATQTSLISPPVEKNTRIEAAPRPEPQVSDQAVNQSDAEWIWPATGKLLSSFSKNSKGVKISGQAGQPVLASAAGEVVYSGHGLRGYGNLVIIKHNNIFLSAYAHNSKILVKEGETVVKGQKIAEMGNTDTDTVQLHFEIRKHGKPVDPMEYLPKQS